MLFIFINSFDFPDAHTIGAYGYTSTNDGIIMGKKRNYLGKSKVISGTLNMLVLMVLKEDSAHGFEILNRIKKRSDEVLIPEEGSLYPAIHRLESQGLIKGVTGKTEKNRTAVIYSLTRNGRKFLTDEIAEWNLSSTAVNQILAWTS